MKPETRVELTRQLEKIKLANEGTNVRWLFLAGTIVEIIMGVGFLGYAMRFMIAASSEDRLYWVSYTFVFLGVVLVAHALYLMFNRFLNRRLRLLYEAVLEVPAST
jgi:hypothetical protein